MSKVSFQHWQQAKEVFEGALELSGSERAAFLDRECGRNAALREEVESLLRSYLEAGSFMESPAVASAAESLVGAQNKLSPGQHVKHYEIARLIGEGGMGEVYLAKDTTLGRHVALKLLPQFLSGNPDRLRRFKQEARTASTLNHPNVCVIHEIGETDDGRSFIAMEYIEGVTLRHRMHKRPMKLGDALDIAIQIAEALRAAHEAGIVHRDIKPENIMVRRDGYVKVLDFGLAKLTERAQTDRHTTISALLVHSSPGTVMGTAAYMSPEQARGVSVDARTDIWSAGVVLYEMISGQPPFAGATPTDVVVAIVERDPPPISQMVRECPVELERIVRKALRKSVEDRYQIVKEMAIDLRSLQNDLQINAQLDRSVTLGFTGASTGKDRAIENHQLESDRSTTATALLARQNSWRRRVGWLALLALVVGGSVFAINKVFKRTKPNSRPRFERLNVTKLSTSGNALLAAISPDGKYVAYVMSENGMESLWLRQVAITSTVQLVPPRPGNYLGLAFAPDGNFVYYGYAATDRNDDGAAYRIPVLGIGASATKMDTENGPQAMSHDGKHVAFLHYDRTNHADLLMTANADGSNEQVLAKRTWPDRFGLHWDTTPAWTPDDKTLAIALVTSDGHPDVHEAAMDTHVSIYEKDLAGGQERIIPLPHQRFDDVGHIGLLPDASGVIMSAKAFGASFIQIWYISRDGSKRTITNDLSDYRELSLREDGNAFVTVQTQTLSKIWLLPKGDSRRPTPVTSGTSRYFDLCWAPDSKVVYASDASGNADIYEMERDGGGARQLTSGAGRNYGPAVSPDGRYIVFHSNRSGIFQVWRIDRDGSNPKQLTFGNSESNWPTFSADGKWVVYQHFESGVPATVWKMPLEGGTGQKVADGFDIRPIVSPDGKWVAFWHNDGQQNSRWALGVVSFESGAAARTFDVAPTVQVRWDALLRWSPDSRSLTYVDHRGGIDNLWAQPIDGGLPKQVTTFTDSRIFSFDWSRDFNLIASRGVITSDVVLIGDAGQ